MTTPLVPTYWDQRVLAPALTGAGNHYSVKSNKFTSEFWTSAYKGPSDEKYYDTTLTKKDAGQGSLVLTTRVQHADGPGESSKGEPVSAQRFGNEALVGQLKTSITTDEATALIVDFKWMPDSDRLQVTALMPAGEYESGYYGMTEKGYNIYYHLTRRPGTKGRGYFIDEIIITRGGPSYSYTFCRDVCQFGHCSPSIGHLNVDARGTLKQQAKMLSTRSTEDIRQQVTLAQTRYEGEKAIADHVLAEGGIAFELKAHPQGRKVSDADLDAMDRPGLKKLAVEVAKLRQKVTTEIAKYSKDKTDYIDWARKLIKKLSSKNRKARSIRTGDDTLLAELTAKVKTLGSSQDVTLNNLKDAETKLKSNVLAIEGVADRKAEVAGTTGEGKNVRRLKVRGHDRFNVRGSSSSSSSSSASSSSSETSGSESDDEKDADSDSDADSDIAFDKSLLLDYDRKY
jgi:hypothetical protein